MAQRPTSETLHAQIKRQILEKIVEGQWKPGFQLPIETDLAKAYGVSRMTMNKVLTQLSNEGYVVRHKKRGTFVALPRAQSAVMEIASIREEVAALGQTYRWELFERSCRHPDAQEQILFELSQAESDADAVFVSGVHFAGPVPFCHEQRVINPASCPEAKDQDFSAKVPGQWLLETIPWSTASHRVRAINAQESDAIVLGLSPGSACLEIVRQTQIEDTWVTRVRLVYPGEIHQLFAQFEPRAGETLSKKYAVKA